jgi:hypothetical protein
MHHDPDPMKHETKVKRSITSGSLTDQDLQVLPYNHNIITDEAKHPTMPIK